jgi:hypothetical protein
MQEVSGSIPLGSTNKSVATSTSEKSFDGPRTSFGRLCAKFVSGARLLCGRPPEGVELSLTWARTGVFVRSPFAGTSCGRCCRTERDLRIAGSRPCRSCLLHGTRPLLLQRCCGSKSIFVGLPRTGHLRTLLRSFADCAKRNPARWRSSAFFPVLGCGCFALWVPFIRKGRGSGISEFEFVAAAALVSSTKINNSRRR